MPVLPCIKGAERKCLAAAVQDSCTRNFHNLGILLLYHVFDSQVYHTYLEHKNLQQKV